MNVDEYPMQAVAPTVAAILGVPAPEASEAGPIARVVEHLRGAARMAILGVDALGLRIWRHWRDRMPFLTALADSRLATLRAVTISNTPRNFACMVTGARVEVHGVTAREGNFACETLFNVLRASGKASAGLGRKGWTGNELLGRFADISAHGDAETDEEVEAILVRVVQDRRPDFLIVQFGLTDETFHAHGPYSAEAGEAVAEADARLSRCVHALREQGYGVIILADHGQHEVEGEDGAIHGKHGTEADDDCVVPLTWTR